MQYNQILSINKVRKNRAFAISLKLIIFLLVSAYIIYVVRQKQDLNISFQKSLDIILRNNPYTISIPFILLFFNWALEAWKWKFLSRKLENISFGKALRGVFTGVSIGFITPFGIGDYAGRILNLNHPDRMKSIGAVFLCRAAQLYITVFFGILSLLYIASVQSKAVISFIGFSLFLALTLSLFFYKKIISASDKIFILNKLYPYLSIVASYEPSEIRKVLLISFARYFIFTLQYILLLRIFDVILPVEIMFAGVSFVFIVRSVIPTLFDLGVRESAAVLFFTFFTNAEENILFASLSLWVINLLIPSIIGLFLIFRLKIFPES